MTWPIVPRIRLVPTTRRRRVLRLITLGVVLLGLISRGQPTTAHADTLNPCLYISTSSPTSADCAPPDLLNLNQSLYSATITQTASLSNLEAQAVTSIIKEHGLAGSDVNAVLSWGRADAQAALFALLVQAIQTPAASRSADQQNAVDWFTAVAQRRAEQAAQDAGLEYVKWAGLNEDSYWSYINAHASQSALQSFLSGTPNADAFCTYHSPAPYASDYTAYPPSTDPADCITAYTNPFSFLTLPPTPSYDQLVKWGESDATYALLSSSDYQSAATSIALGLDIGLPLGAAATAGATAGSVVAAAVSSAGAFASIGVEESVLDTVLLTVAEAVGDAAVAVGEVLAALATAIVAGIDVSTDAKLPGQLATLITSAASTPPDLPTLESSTDGAQTLYSLFVGATLPTPLNQTCANSAILPPSFTGNGGGTVIHTNGCLNPTPIPPAAASDPQFVVQKQGGVTGGASSAITWTDKAAGTTATTRLSGNWFVEQVNGATVQTLHITYTDWNGAEQTAWLVGNPTDGYAFLTVASLANAGTTVDPATCQAAGLCSYGPTIDFIGSDGSDDQASVQVPRATGPIPGQLAPGTVSGDDPTGSPIAHSHVCDSTDEGCEVEFDANTFGPLDAFNDLGQIVSPMTYTWEFQQTVCNLGCLQVIGPSGPIGPDYTAPIHSTGTTYHTFPTSGTYAVRLTATDANGKQAVDTFSLTIGDVPPALSLDPACPQANPCDTRTAQEGTALSLGGTITHAGAQDIENVSVTWGDGSVDNAYCGVTNPSGGMCGPGAAVSGGISDGANGDPLSLTPDASQTHIALSDTHTYARAGTYYVTVSVSDQGGGTDSQTFVETVTNPAPTTSSLSLTPPGACSPIVNPLANLVPPAPAVAAIGSSPLVTVTGGGFVPGSTVYWNGAPLTTTYLSSCQVMAQVPTTDTASATVGTLAVANAAPGGGISNPQAMYITPDGTLAGAALATSVNGSAAAVVGGHSNLIGGVGLAGTPGTLSATASGAGALGLAQYSADPIATTPPSAVNAYFDVFVPIGGSFSSVRVTDCNLGGGSLVYYFDSTAGRWTPVSGQTYNAGAGCVSFTLSPTSAPDLLQISGAVFGAGHASPTVANPGAWSVHYGGAVSIPISATDVETATTLTLSATGLPAGLALADDGDGTGTVTGTVSAPVGVYTATLTATDGFGGATPVTVPLTVTAAPLTITADSKSMSYGGGAPAFTASDAGLVNGDTSSVVSGLSCGATDGSGHAVGSSTPPGTYTITCSGAGAANYAISYMAGTLTVSPAPLTITADNQHTVYGQTPTDTWTGAGWVNGESASTLSTTPNSAPTCSASVNGAPASATTPPGVYAGAITCQGAVDPNYSISYKSGTLTIDPLISLDEQGLPGSVPHQATLDGKTVSLPDTNVAVPYNSTHSYSFPASVTDSSSGTVYFTADQGFSGNVTANISDTAVYQTMAQIVGADLSAGGIDNGGQANALTHQFAAVQADIQAGNTAQALADLHTFAAHVRAQSGQHLTAATAQALLADAQLVYAHLGRSGSV